MSTTTSETNEGVNLDGNVQRSRHLYLLIVLIIIVSLFSKPILDSSVATLKPGGEGEKIILLIAPFIIVCTVCITLLEIIMIAFLRVFRSESMRNLFSDFLKYLGFGASIGGSIGIMVAVVSMMGAYSSSLPDIKSVDYVGILASLGLYTSFVIFLLFRFPIQIYEYNLRFLPLVLMFIMAPLLVMAYLKVVFSFSSDSIRADLISDFYPEVRPVEYSTSLYDFIFIFVAFIFIFFISVKWGCIKKFVNQFR